VRLCHFIVPVKSKEIQIQRTVKSKPKTKNKSKSKAKYSKTKTKAFQSQPNFFFEALEGCPRQARLFSLLLHSCRFSYYLRTGSPFPGCAAILLQEEHMMLSHDIPSPMFRGSPMLQYLVGHLAKGCLPPLLPLGMNRCGRFALRGGSLTGAVFSIEPFAVDREKLTGPVSCRVDVFTPNYALLDDLLAWQSSASTEKTDELSPNSELGRKTQLTPHTVCFHS